jgi:hypothetical protein
MPENAKEIFKKSFPLIKKNIMGMTTCLTSKFVFVLKGNINILIPINNMIVLSR